MIELPCNIRSANIIDGWHKRQLKGLTTTKLGTSQGRDMNR